MKLICWHRFIIFGPVRTLLLSGVVLCSAFFIFLIGCGKVEQHKILTFFFDGVPPLGLEYLDPNSPDYAAQVKKIKAVSRGSRHETGKDCKHCHKDGILNKPVPQLCYTCHDDYREQGIYVHAPVLVGDCLFCHEAHEASNSFLLKESIPGMCLKCHDRRTINLIDDHENEEYDTCLSCHSGHSSNSRGMLKRDVIAIPKKTLNEKENAESEKLINMIRPVRENR